MAALAMLGDVRARLTRLGGFRWSALVAALGLALGHATIRGVRWALYLRRHTVRVPPRVGTLVCGAGLSRSITPGKVGERRKSERYACPRPGPRRSRPTPGPRSPALSFLPRRAGGVESATAMWRVRGATRLERSAAIDASLLTRLGIPGGAVGLGLICPAVARHLIRLRANAAAEGARPA